MTQPTRPLLLSAWLGFALACLFFYPLAAVIEAEPYYLQWRPSHAWETAVAILMLAIGIGPLVYATWTRTSRTATLLRLVGTAIPLLSVGAGVARQLTFDNVLWDAWERPQIRYAVLAGAAAAFIFFPQVVGRLFRGALIAVSPIALVVISTLVSSSRVVQVTAIDREPQPTQASCPSVFAMLFDEMSFSYLHDGDRIRPEFPNLKTFSDTATNHLRVTSPGAVTLASVTGYLAARRFDQIHVVDDHLEYEVGDERATFAADAPDGVFASARRMGFAIEVAGFYFPYCQLLGSLADTCRSYSFYNAANAGLGFSPLHPILTTAILWPSNFPHRLFRHPGHAYLQRLRVEQTRHFAMRPFDRARPTFRYIHFGIPHLPFAFDAEGGRPSVDPMQTTSDVGYVGQLRYTDRLIGEILSQLRQSGALEHTTVAIFSDHGFLGRGAEKNTRHVPFIVRSAGQTSRVDVTAEEQGETLLRSLVDRCGT